jgi:hypothetical protein
MIKRKRGKVNRSGGIMTLISTIGLGWIWSGGSLFAGETGQSKTVSLNITGSTFEVVPPGNYSGVLAAPTYNTIRDIPTFIGMKNANAVDLNPEIAALPNSVDKQAVQALANAIPVSGINTQSGLTPAMEAFRNIATASNTGYSDTTAAAQLYILSQQKTQAAASAASQASVSAAQQASADATARANNAAYAAKQKAAEAAAAAAAAAAANTAKLNALIAANPAGAGYRLP